MGEEKPERGSPADEVGRFRVFTNSRKHDMRQQRFPDRFHHAMAPPALLQGAAALQWCVRLILSARILQTQHTELQRQAYRHLAEISTLVAVCTDVQEKKLPSP